MTKSDSKKLPAMQFYPGDWRKDNAVQSLGFHDRGVWFEMLCLMHESTERGVLLLNRLPMPEPALARILGIDAAVLRETLSTLLNYGVARQREDGAIYSKRMVEDEARIQIQREHGHRGGNPKLIAGYTKPGVLYAVQRESDRAVKIGITNDIKTRFSKLRHTNRPDTLTLIDHQEVENMGEAEAAAHGKLILEGKQVLGEWFRVTDDDLLALGFTLKGTRKGLLPPTSLPQFRAIPEIPQIGDFDSGTQENEDFSPENAPTLKGGSKESLKGLPPTSSSSSFKTYKEEEGVNADASIDAEKQAAPATKPKRRASSKQRAITFDFEQHSFCGLDAAQLQIWQAAFPLVSVEAEVLRAGAWADCNTYRPDYRKFLMNWLSRAQTQAAEKQTNPRSTPGAQNVRNFPSPAVSRADQRAATIAGLTTHNGQQPTIRPAGSGWAQAAVDSRDVPVTFDDF